MLSSVPGCLEGSTGDCACHACCDLANTCDPVCAAVLMAVTDRCTAVTPCDPSSADCDSAAAGSGSDVTDCGSAAAVRDSDPTDCGSAATDRDSAMTG